MKTLDRVNRKDVMKMGAVGAAASTSMPRCSSSYVPGDVGGPIVTEASLATGHIRFYASNSATTGFLEGTGVVMRI